MRHLLSAVREKKTAARMQAFSALLLHRRYVANPIGDGPGPGFDPRPLYRFNVFDCFTYMQTVLCLSLARNVKEFEQLNLETRYLAAKAHYLRRARLVFTQWLPLMVKKNYLHDITREVAGEPEMMKRERVMEDYRYWLRIAASDLDECKGSRRRLLKELKQQTPPGLVARGRVQDFIPVSSFFIRAGRKRNVGKVNEEMIARIPEGAVVVFRNRDHIHFALTHRKNGILYIRHACNIKNRMIEDVFARYYLGVYLLSTFREIAIFRGASRGIKTS